MKKSLVLSLIVTGLFLFTACRNTDTYQPMPDYVVDTDILEEDEPTIEDEIFEDADTANDSRELIEDLLPLIGESFKGFVELLGANYNQLNDGAYRWLIDDETLLTALPVHANDDRDTIIRAISIAATHERPEDTVSLDLVNQIEYRMSVSEVIAIMGIPTIIAADTWDCESGTIESQINVTFEWGMSALASERVLILKMDLDRDEVTSITQLCRASDGRYDVCE